MNDNLFSYHGIVRRRILKRGKVIKDVSGHNVGTFNMFHLFCSALASPPNNIYTPQSIDVCFEEGGTFVSLLGNNVAQIGGEIVSTAPTTSVSGKAGTQLGDCSVTLSASLTRASIDYSTVVSEGSESNIFFVLRNGVSGANNILAYYEDTTTKARDFKIATDEVYLVDWTLNVGNYQTPTTTSKSKSRSRSKKK